jgi:hypothetical protein
VDLVDQAHHPRHPLATVQAKLLVIKRVHVTAHGNNALPHVYMNRAQAGDVTLIEKIENAAFQIQVRITTKKGRHLRIAPAEGILTNGPNHEQPARREEQKPANPCAGLEKLGSWVGGWMKRLQPPGKYLPNWRAARLLS